MNKFPHHSRIRYTWAALLLLFLTVSYFGFRWRQTSRAGAKTQPVISEQALATLPGPIERKVEAAWLAVQTAPESADRWGTLGSVLDAHHLYDSAERCYRQANALAPQDFRWAYLLAVVLDFQGKEPAEIERWYRECHRLQVNYAPAYVRAADAFLRFGDFQKARAASELACRYDENLGHAWRTLAQACVAGGDFEVGESAFRRARACLPDDATTLYGLGQLLRQLGRLAEAETVTAEAATRKGTFSLPDQLRYEVEQHALDPASLARRGKDAMLRGDFSAAVQEFVQILAFVPEETTTMLRLATCYARLGELDAAEATVTKIVQHEPSMTSAWLLMAELNEASGDLPQALVHYGKVKELDPTHCQAVLHAAKLHGMLGQLHEALQEYAHAATLGSLDAEAHHNWGTVLQRQGEIDAAVQHFLTALEIEPRIAATRYNLGLAYEDLGQIDAAILEYQQAVAVNASSPAKERLYALGALLPAR